MPVAVTENDVLPPAAAVALSGCFVITGGTAAAFIVMVNATAADVPPAFVAVTVKFDVPAAVGVPEMTPLLLMVSPAGSEPLATVQLVGEFEAASVTL